MTAIDPDALSRLQAALEARATEKSRTFWSKYLKGDAAFRGVPMAGVREAVHAWWRAEAIDERSPDAQVDVALRLLEEAYTEDKMAGVLALSEIVMPHLGKQHLPAFARLFANGHIFDWNLCDWFCVKVLGKLLDHAQHPLDLAAAIASWRASGPLWQRRAACVAFVNHGKHGDARIPGLMDLVFASAEALVRDPERFAQTGVGWVLRECSLADRERVIAFGEQHVERLSHEAMKSMVEKMPAEDKARLLALHKAVASSAKRKTAR